MKYPIMFRANDVCTIRMAPEGLAYGRDPKYPLCDYHGKEVVVVAQEDAKGEVIRDTYPDDQGLVDVKLPFPFKPDPLAEPIWTIPVLYSVLQRKR